MSVAARTGLVAVLLWSGPASAQMMLPGANNGSASGSSETHHGGGGGGPPPAPLKPIVIKPPSEDTLIGHALAREGRSGAMTFERAGNDLVLAKLKLEGDKISKPQQACSMDVSIVTPIVAKPAGRPEGALRFEVPLESCPFTIDVLEGSVLVSRSAPICEFKSADCRVAPGGLWGPAAADISVKQVKDLERQRARIETTMRANYRALVKKAGKDRDAVKTIARAQAAFSSEREMTCRDYDKETQHGFCSTQITEARALSLLAQFGPVAEKADERRRARSKAKTKAAEPTPAAEDSPPGGEP